MRCPTESVMCWGVCRRLSSYTYFFVRHSHCHMLTWKRLLGIWGLLHRPSLSSSIIQSVKDVIWLAVLFYVLLGSFAKESFKFQPLYVFLIKLVRYMFQSALYRLRWNGVKLWVITTLLLVFVQWLLPGPVLSTDNIYIDASNLAFSVFILVSFSANVRLSW